MGRKKSDVPKYTASIRLPVSMKEQIDNSGKSVSELVTMGLLSIGSAQRIADLIEQVRILTEQRTLLEDELKEYKQ